MTKSNDPDFKHISIIGLGLLGASLAGCCKSKNASFHITGISSSATLKKAKERELIDEGFTYADMSKGIVHSDLILLCTPITHILETLTSWEKELPKFKKGCIITDVGSTKEKICTRANQVFPQYQQAHFIGSHPMAGSEKSGIEARDDFLFENASWIICPEVHTPDEPIQKLTNFINWVGAQVISLAPVVHDKVVAHVSHLPQLLSTALAGFFSERHSDLQNALQIAGGGFRDMTRLADSSYQIWKPILSSNKTEIIEVLNNYLHYLQNLHKEFKNDNLEEAFLRGKDLRNKLTQHSGSYAADLAEILLQVPDKPGILAKVLNIISSLGLNVTDLEVVKVREGESGTIKIAFKSSKDAKLAVSELKSNDYLVKMR